MRVRRASWTWSKGCAPQWCTAPGQRLTGLSSDRPAPPQCARGCWSCARPWSPAPAESGTPRRQCSGWMMPRVRVGGWQHEGVVWQRSGQHPALLAVSCPQGAPAAELEHDCRLEPELAFCAPCQPRALTETTLCMMHGLVHQASGACHSGERKQQKASGRTGPHLSQVQWSKDVRKHLDVCVGHQIWQAPHPRQSRRAAATGGAHAGCSATTS